MRSRRLRVFVRDHLRAARLSMRYTLVIRRGQLRLFKKLAKKVGVSVTAYPLSQPYRLLIQLERSGGAG